MCDVDYVPQVIVFRYFQLHKSLTASHVIHLADLPSSSPLSMTRNPSSFPAGSKHPIQPLFSPLKPSLPPAQIPQEDSYPLSGHSIVPSLPPSCPYQDYNAPVTTHMPVAPAHIVQIALPAAPDHVCLSPILVLRWLTVWFFGERRVRTAFGAGSGLFGGWRGVRGEDDGRESGLGWGLIAPLWE